MKDKYTPREVAIAVLKKAEELLKGWHEKNMKKNNAALMSNETGSKAKEAAVRAAPFKGPVQKPDPKAKEAAVSAGSFKGSPLKMFLKKRELKKKELNKKYFKKAQK